MQSYLDLEWRVPDVLLVSLDRHQVLADLLRGEGDARIALQTRRVYFVKRITSAGETMTQK